MFGSPSKGGPGPALDPNAPPDDGQADPSADDPAENEDALNSAIDEMFTATDPVQRREAFKTACKLCDEDDQAGKY